ncbi:hypothetical protein [Chamaesiphon sp.]|uniref:hypothetical protein n=1 Tax=Chamaesiphon sp. TaxID=2814140 RepID=UPI003593E7C4
MSYILPKFGRFSKGEASQTSECSIIPAIIRKFAYLQASVPIAPITLIPAVRDKLAPCRH